MFPNYAPSRSPGHIPVLSSGSSLGTSLSNQSKLALGEENSRILGLNPCPVSDREKRKSGWTSREFPEFSPCCQQFSLSNQQFSICIVVVDGFFPYNVPVIHAKLQHPGARNSLGVELNSQRGGKTLLRPGKISSLVKREEL